MRRLILACTVLLAAVPVFAAGPWLSYDTEHFTFIYRGEFAYALEQLAPIAEDVYDRVSGFVGASPDHIDVVIYGDTDFANGYFTPAPPEHIGLYISQPSLQFTGARTEDWYRSLLTHELTHFVHGNYGKGIFDLAGSIFGRSISSFSLGFMPTWTAEGLAVNAESRLAPGGRGTDPFFEMQYRAMVIESRLPSIAQIGIPAYSAPYGRRYVEGYPIWNYLLDTYGEETFPQYMERFVRWPFFGIWGPVRRTIGIPLRQAYDEMNEKLRVEYADRIAMTPSPRITPEGRGDYYLPQPTARGLYLYRTRPDSRPAIVALDADTGHESRVLEMNLSDYESWRATPDGALVAFATADVDGLYPDEQAARSNLFVYDVDTRTTRRITASGGFFQPALSPDARTIVAVERDGAFERLVTVDTTSLRVEPFVELPETTFYTPVFSPDGSRVAAIANHHGEQRIVVVSLASGMLTVLPATAHGVPYDPRFDGNDAILFGNDAGGNLAVYRASLADTGDGPDLPTYACVATDPVGAYAASSGDDALYVAVYTADGYAVRRVMHPVSDAAARALDTVPAGDSWFDALAGSATASASGAHDSTATAGEPLVGTRYVSAPLPAFWLPAVGTVRSDLDPTGFGAGVYLYGSDLLARNSWEAQLRAYPFYGQGDYAATWLTAYGRLGLTLAASSAFTVLSDAGTSLEDFNHGAALDLAIVRQHTLGRSTVVTLHAGARHEVSLVSATPFSLGEIGSSGVSIGINKIVLGGGISASSVPRSPEQAAVTPGAVAASAYLSTPIDAPDFRFDSWLITTAGSANLDLGANNIVSLAPSVTFANRADAASRIDLRGFGTSTDHTASESMRGRYLVALDYHAPLLLTDIAILPSFGITSFGASLFAEATGGFDAGTFAIDRAVSIGAELSTDFWYLTEIPLTMGVALRVDPRGPTSFAFPDDMTFYISSSLLESVGALPEYLRRE